MGKIQLTEGQYERLKKNLIKNVLNEGPMDTLNLLGTPLAASYYAIKDLYDYSSQADSDENNPYAPLKNSNYMTYEMPQNSWSKLYNYLQGLYPGKVSSGISDGSEYYSVGTKGKHVVSFWQNLDSGDADNASSVNLRVNGKLSPYGWCPNGAKAPSSFSNETQVGPAVGGGKCVDLAEILPAPTSQKSNVTEDNFDILRQKLQKVDKSYNVTNSRMYPGSLTIKKDFPDGSTIAFYQDLKKSKNAFVFVGSSKNYKLYYVPSEAAAYNGEELSDYFVVADGKMKSIAQLVGASNAAPSGAKPAPGGSSPKPKPKPVQKFNVADYL